MSLFVNLGEQIEKLKIIWRQKTQKNTKKPLLTPKLVDLTPAPPLHPSPPVLLWVMLTLPLLHVLDMARRYTQP
jgi:hypothetical protein